MSLEKSHEVIPSIGDDVSKMLYNAAKLSWDNRHGAVVEMHPSFSGLRALRPDYKPTDCYESMGSDGIGTKVEIAERLADHSVVAYDLFAMACDDAVVRGAEPVAINTVLDVNMLDLKDPVTAKAIEELAHGYVGAAEDAGVAILNGETAELSNRIGGYGPFNYNWCATVLWYAQQDRLLTGHQIQPGDSLVGLKEDGFRSNGITDVRQGMLEEYGPDWHNKVVKSLGNVSLGRQVQQPSKIYSRLVTALTGGFDINNEPRAKISGAAHITGGGQPEKIRRMLEPSGLGAGIPESIEPPDIMLHVQELCGFDDEKAYSKWHMGSGMVIATPEPEKVIEEAAKFGIYAQEMGVVTENPIIKIRNMGALAQKKYLRF